MGGKSKQLARSEGKVRIRIGGGFWRKKVLVTCQLFVDLHGGNVVVSSSAEDGTTFTVQFPRTIPPL
jgi:hypothetical protein